MKAIVTGAAGFSGSILTDTLRKNGIEVYAIVREGSAHNERLDPDDEGLHLVMTDLEDLADAADIINDQCDVFFHLAWNGGRCLDELSRNADYCLEAVRLAKSLGCRKFIATGSQAEYGIVPPDIEQTEDRKPSPFTSYGTVKVAACYLSRQLATELDIEWIWGRIFSLIGKNEPAGRMLPDLFRTLKEGRDFNLSSCRQNWDYLDVYDAADALLALAQKGQCGEIYNIANGAYRPLKEYTEKLKSVVGGSGRIIYGPDADPCVSLQPSVNKIKQDTGWNPKRSFEDSIADYDQI